jgi:hypothetical protein
MAERIARRVGAGSESVQSSNPDINSELSAIRVTLNELQNRLIQIESKVSAPVSEPRMHSPWLAGVNASHPSQERFGVEEATVAELVDFFQNEKNCSLEPGGKPCDHCAMCSARGF